MKCKLRRALWALPCLPVDDTPEFFAGIVVCNWLVILSVCITLMCTFDPTGRTFVKLKATRRRQRNLTTYTLRYFWLFFIIIIIIILQPEAEASQSAAFLRFLHTKTSFFTSSPLDTGSRKAKPAAGAGDSSSSCAAQEPRIPNQWVTSHARQFSLLWVKFQQTGMKASSGRVIKLSLDWKSRALSEKELAARLPTA